MGCAVAILIFIIELAFIVKDLFERPLTFEGDLAANSLQVQDAKQFREMLGNYSRFRFHHPGPAFYYVMAAGEALLSDRLRVVPAPENAEIVAMILLNLVFFVLTLTILSQNFQSPAFLPLAAAMSLYWVCTVNHTLGYSALLISNWMPYVLVIPFLLFVACCASVASGTVRHLPVLAMSAGFLIHAHVAQLLFVIVLAGMSFVSAARFLTRADSFRCVLAKYKFSFVSALAICAIFVFPIALEATIDHPNNIDDIRRFLSEHPDFEVTLRNSVRYFLSFLAHVPNANAVAPDPNASLWSLAWGKAYLRVYYVVSLIVFLFAAFLSTSRRRIPRFFLILCGEIALISLLSIFWGMRIVGPLYSFNGFFIYSLQLLALLGALGLFADGVLANISARTASLALCLVSACAFAGEHYLHNSYSGAPELRAAANAVPSGCGTLKLQFVSSLWPNSAGIAAVMKRENKPFCVSNDWVFIFGRRNACVDKQVAGVLEISNPGVACPAGNCRELFLSQDLSVHLLR